MQRTTREPCCSISQIVLTNFKCFSESTVVGPFRAVTSVIGPNGSGKSSVFDAIAFVLCKDHIFPGKRFLFSELANPKAVASDEAVRVEVEIEQDGGRVSLERRLTSNQVDQFLIDGATVDKHKFLQRLRGLALLGALVVG